MALEERLTILETEFRTELKHFATKADLKEMESRLTLRLGGLMVGLLGIGFGTVIAVIRLWL